MSDLRATAQKLISLASAATPGPYVAYIGQRGVYAKRDTAIDVAIATFARGDERTKESFSMQANLSYFAASDPTTIIRLATELIAALDCVEATKAYTKLWDYDNECHPDDFVVLREALATFDLATQSKERSP